MLINWPLSYIHGGAWRDPNILASSFDATRDVLASQYGSNILPKIDAIASINYRLTAHPNFPQDSAAIGLHESRHAVHPDHLNDVRRAIAFLQAQYGFKENYILVGHSCGATLAFQLTMKGLSSNSIHSQIEFGSIRISTPLAIVGVCGIYDLRGLRDSFKDCYIYQDFIESAFGPSEDVWDEVSPAKVEGGGGVEGGWKNGLVAVLAHSTGDELTDIRQSKSMVPVLEDWAGQNKTTRKVVFIDNLSEGHDEIWQNGTELASVIVKAVEALSSSPKADS